MKRVHWIQKSLALLLVLLLATACGKKEQAPVDDGRLDLVATTGMIGDIAARIGGERVRVTTLMGPGVDPHLYKASAGDLRRLTGADLVLVNGLHLEGRMGEVLEKLGPQKVLAVSQGIPESLLLESVDYPGHFDPHIWFDPRLWILAAENIGQALKDRDAEHADAHWKRTRELTRELTDMHGWALKAMGSIQEAQRVLVTSHDAFRYFGKAYGCQVRGLQGISTASEAGTADVQDLARFISERKLPAIFVESSIPRRTMEAVAAAVRSRGHEVRVGAELFSDAMGDAGTPEGTYTGMFRFNVTQIVRALGGKLPEQP